MKFKFLVLLAFIVLFLGCEKEQEAIDDDGEEQIENNITIENDDINTYEVVTFTIVGANLNDSYTAKLGNTDVILNKIDDTTLGLLIPAIDNGTYTLDFELGNIDINVTQTTLGKAKEVVLDEYKAKVVENFSPTTTIPKSQGAAILENIFANATEDEKQAIALFFEANNEVFNEIINSQSSISNKDHAELNERARKFNINVLQLGIGTVAVVGASALGTTGFGAILAGAGLGLMYDSIPDALNEGQGMINEGTRQVDFDIINGSSSGKSHNTAAKDGSLTFINKQANLLSANYGIRGLDKTDRVLNDIYFFKTFFFASDKLNKITGGLNAVINLVNEIPFVNIPLFNSITIPEKGTVKNEILRVEEFPNYSFSVSNGKVTINPKFKEDGQIEIILTADESLDLSEPIEFQMTVDYKDEFNNLTNTYDIELGDEFNLIGSWNVENVDTTRYDTGTASCNGISNQYSTDISIKFNFSEETGVDTTLKTVEEYQNEMCTANGWQGNYEVYTDTVKGYFDWSITGNTLITVYDNGTDSYNNVLNIIDNNNIQITTEDGDVITLTRE